MDNSKKTKQSSPSELQKIEAAGPIGPSLALWVQRAAATAWTGTAKLGGNTTLDYKKAAEHPSAAGHAHSKHRLKTTQARECLWRLRQLAGGGWSYWLWAPKAGCSGAASSPARNASPCHLSEVTLQTVRSNSAKTLVQVQALQYTHFFLALAPGRSFLAKCHVVYKIAHGRPDRDSSPWDFFLHLRVLKVPGFYFETIAL